MNVNILCNRNLSTSGQRTRLILPEIPYSEHTEISNYPSKLSHMYTWSKIRDIVTLYLAYDVVRIYCISRRDAKQDRECHCINDYVTYVTVLKTNCILWLPARWISPNELCYMKRLFENFLNMTHCMIWGNLCSYSHSKMLKCSLGYRNYCINHLQSKHPNEMATSCLWRPQGHGRRWGLSCWQPPTPPVMQWLPHTLRYFPELIIGVWYR